MTINALINSLWRGRSFCAFLQLCRTSFYEYFDFCFLRSFIHSPIFSSLKNSSRFSWIRTI
eukprot:UN12083